MKSILYVLAITCVIYAAAGSVFAEPAVYRNHRVAVAQGDTLWEIAARHTERKEDVRVVVDRIVKANNIQNAHIYPGQILQVPIRVQDSGLMMANK